MIGNTNNIITNNFYKSLLLNKFNKAYFKNQFNTYTNKIFNKVKDLYKDIINTNFIAITRRNKNLYQYY